MKRLVATRRSDIMPHTFCGSRPQESSHDQPWTTSASTSTQVCILTENGELIERRIKTDRESFDKLFAGKQPARILVEASTESEWCARRHRVHLLRRARGRPVSLHAD